MTLLQLAEEAARREIGAVFHPLRPQSWELRLAP